MPRELTVPSAERMLRARSGLMERGMTERDIAAAVQSGALIRVRRGWYVAGDDWADLWREGRHLLEVVAVRREATYAAPPFCLESAAVLHGLPLYRTQPSAVHTLTAPTSHSRRRSGVARHSLALGEDDLTEVAGIACTSLERTVVDLARTLHPEAAVASADAALRRIAVVGHRQDESVAAAWRERLDRRMSRSSNRGIRQARRVVAFADGRAQLPGESVSRLLLHRLGFRDIELQPHVTSSDGRDFWLDFGFPQARAFGEFDGLGKYVSPEMRGDRSIDDVVIAEKRREDEVRGVTGWRIVRWGSEHIRSEDALGARLAAFGIRPR
ncbi:hypothetical protein MRBLWO14_002725 [Microbacterium sp. LWO14-1.2]|uniref:hypothetical protein n=1 Tax=Microbacterium sp. LWO14-1.2 TaxID=3135263 RepID=UPI003138E229